MLSAIGKTSLLINDTSEHYSQTQKIIDVPKDYPTEETRTNNKG
jgi:hypothetical protein